MELINKNIGFAITGAFSTFDKSIFELQKLCQLPSNIFPIMSFNSYSLDTRFGKAKDFVNKIEKITDHNVIHTIQDAEQIRSKSNI